MTEADLPPDQNAREKNYRCEFLRWIASLDPKDRDLARELGIDRPKIEAASAVWAGGEVFRDSPSTAGHQDRAAADEFVHPADLIDESEDDELPHDPDEIERLAKFDPEVLQTLLRVLVVPDGGRPGNLKAILCRTIALCHALHVPGVGDRSLTELAEKIGCTRGLLSAYAVRLRDFGGLDCKAGKSVSARAKMSASKLWHTGSRTKRKKQKGPVFPVGESQTQEDSSCDLS